MTHKIILALTIALCGLAFGAGGASATQFVTNGGFESSASTTSTAFFGAATPATDWASTEALCSIAPPPPAPPVTHPQLAAAGWQGPGTDTPTV
jgi:hypothetical protein